MKFIAFVLSILSTLGLSGCRKPTSGTWNSVRIENSNPHGSFDAGVVRELEQANEVQLPADYLDYLRLHNGGHPEPDSFSVVPNDWGSGIHELYGAQRAEEEFSLLRNLNWGGLPLKPGMLVIGEDGAFGYILMSMLPADFGSIHFCCTWSNHPNGYGGQGYWRIADSFSDFIKHLEKGSEERHTG